MELWEKAQESQGLPESPLRAYMLLQLAVAAGEVASGRTVGPGAGGWGGSLAATRLCQFLSQRLIGSLCFAKGFSKDWGTV